MPTPYFYIDKKQAKKNNVCKIMFRLSNGQDIYTYATQQEVSIALWDTKKQRVKKHSNPTIRDANKINKTLNTIHDTAIDNFEIFQLTNKRPPSKEEFKKVMDEQLGRVKIEKTKATTTTLYEFMEEYANTKTEMVSKTRGEQLQILIRYIKQYAESQNKKEYQFCDIDINWYEKFLHYLQIKKKLKPSYIAGLVSILRQLLSAAIEKYATQMSVTPNTIKKFVVAEKFVVADSIYLLPKEVEMIANLDLSKHEDLVKYRDLFIIGCYTGYRHSDYSQITPINIQNGFFIKQPQKTLKKKIGNKIYIPIHPTVQKILDKYNNKLPTTTRTSINNKLPIIGKLAGIDTPTEKPCYQDGKISFTTVPKYELISSHTARRTFATNHYLKTRDASLTMQFTGHSTMATFMNYVKASNLERQQAAYDQQGSSFFSS